jgi:hypothetical protein
MVVKNISKLHISFSFCNHHRIIILTTFNTTTDLTMAASTPMNDDWEMVFIDEDGEVVSGKATVARSKQKGSIEFRIAPVAESKQEAPIEIDILTKECQLAEKKQKESSEKRPAKPVQIRRPVRDCYRPTYAFKGSYSPAKHFDKQDALDWSSHLFDPSGKVVESAAKTASKEFSNVDQERTKYSQEMKAWTVEQFQDDEKSLALAVRLQTCSAKVAGPSV